MSFYADLHIHSKYSRATSRQCDLEHLYLWARKKGITVVATGDFTHPAWQKELREKLIPAEPGLFRLKPDIEAAMAKEVPATCQGETRFTLSVEISTIYKKGEKTRKVHHVIYAPDFDHAGRFSEALARIGNITSDGRPILGLDSRNLLEIALESGDGAYLIPAHIWTPWFSALGSKSGFDSIDACYGDLAGHIFAEETGLSTDPPMHWRVSSLDRFRLVSNSDAHSPEKLGRNACVFDCPMDYFSMRAALESGEGYGGTVEFYPEEGKYHLDGHRKCGVRLEPAETRKYGGRCPECGKPLTLGVLYRVEELADRPEGEYRPGRDPYCNLIPLKEVLSEIEGVGPQSKRVMREYEALLNKLGPELAILAHTPLDEVAAAAPGRLAEALRRMRSGEVIREAGYDGEFGVIRLFSAKELADDCTADMLFPEESVPKPAPKPPRKARKTRTTRGTKQAKVKKEEDASAAAPLARETQPAYTPPLPTGNPLLDGLDEAQRAAAQVIEGPLLIIAGPGTGKTRTVTHRLAHLVKDHGVPPEACLAITFTRRAADEMRERLVRLIPDEAERVVVRTFHALGLEIMREHAEALGLPQAFAVAGDGEREALLMQVLECPARKASQWVKQIALGKRQGSEPEAGSEFAMVWERYNAALRERNLVDFEDLLRLPVTLLEAHEEILAAYRERFRWVSIDEYQDIDALQYRLVRLLAPAHGNVCAIGDPDQAIYRFRGADVGFFNRFREDYPNAEAVSLKRSYRCARNILDASRQVVSTGSDEAGRLESLMETPDRLIMHEAPTDKAEAEFVVHTMEQLVGGHTFFSLDSGRSTGAEDTDLAFSDFAILYRTDAQSNALCEALARSGIPYQKRSHQRLADEPVARQLTTLLRARPGNGSVQARLHDAAEALEACAKGDTAPLGPDWVWPEGTKPPEAEDAEAFVDQLGVVTALLAPLAIQAGDDLPRFLDDLALGAEMDCWDPRAERVSLLTLHAAKGLEFAVVFIVGCEDGLLPLKWGSQATEEDLAEERRLFYVGMTRAKRRLILSHANRRVWRGKPRKAEPSPFLAEIAEQLLEHRATTAKKRTKTAADSQLDLF